MTTLSAITPSYAANWKTSISLKLSSPLDFVILNEVKNLVPRVHCWGLYNVKSICICEILRVAQNDKVNVALFLPTSVPLHILA